MNLKYILDNLIFIYVLGMMDVKVKPKDGLFEVNYLFLYKFLNSKFNFLWYCDKMFKNKWYVNSPIVFTSSLITFSKLLKMVF